jgi:cytochrome c-type biogenesis protein CcsB
MAPLETICVWIAIGLYAIASVLYIYSVVFKNERILRWIVYPVILAFLVHSAAIFARYSAIGNLPVAGDYETALGGTWIIVLFTLYLSIRHKTLRPVGVATLPFSLLLLGFGVMRTPVLSPMAASVRSFWLYIHVLFAQVAFGAYTIAFAFAILYLLKENNPEKKFYNRLPDLLRLDELMFRFVVFGFITDAVMIASGAIWAKNLWGNYWSWDPVEMWSFVTWLIYGLSIHLRFTMGWKGRKMAWIIICALLCMVITFFGINVFVDTSVHVFEVSNDL